MNLISNILLAENILIDTESASKKRVFERVGLIFENNQQISRSLVFDSLFAREKLGSTGLGHGIAIPHGRISKLREPTAAFIKTTHPIPFEAHDGLPVTILCVLLVPERANDTHLQLLSELAQMFSDETFRLQLEQSTQSEEIYQLFCNWQSS